jgi:hypothetical protein
MKTVKDLNVGDKVYFYYSELGNIETKVISDIVEVLPDQFKISIAGIGEVFYYHGPDQNKVHNYYLTLDQAKRQLISDKKGEIIALQVAKKRLDAEIETLESAIEFHRTDG